MGMLRRNRVKFSVIAVVAALILGIVGTGLILGAFYEDGIYEGPVDVGELQTARGLVYDWAQTSETVGVTGVLIRDWMISGEWTLDCGNDACKDADPGDIEFDMAIAMIRDSIKAEANSSHGHIFSDFSATSATVAGDELTIEGEITGSGPIATDGITIRLRRHGGPPNNPLDHFTFFFKMDAGNIITTEVGGVVVESSVGQPPQVGGTTSFPFYGSGSPAVGFAIIGGGVAASLAFLVSGWRRQRG